MTQSPNPFSREGAGAGDGLGPAEGNQGGSAGSSSGWPSGQPTPPPPPPAPDPVRPEPAPNPWPTYPTGSEQPPYEQPPYGQAPYQPPAANPYGYSAGDIGGYGSADSGFVNPTPQPVQAYGGQQYGMNPYGSYGSAMAAPNHPQAIVSLILSLVGLMLCQPVGIAGFILGAKARREIDANPTSYSGRGLATAGWVIGLICIIITVLGVVGIIASIATS